LIKENKDKSHLLERAGTDLFRGLFTMLINDRLDYILGYPGETQYLAKDMNVADKVRFLPAAEAPDYLIDYVGCPKNDWGKKVLDDLNVVIEAEREKQLIPFYEAWLDENSLARYRKLSQEYFKK
jgi:uncharacterized protein (TIGR02285 family)